MTIKAISDRAQVSSGTPDAATAFGNIAHMQDAGAVARAASRDSKTTRELRAVLQNMIDLRDVVRKGPNLTPQTKQDITEILNIGIAAARDSLNTPGASERQRKETLDFAEHQLSQAYKILFGRPARQDRTR